MDFEKDKDKVKDPRNGCCWEGKYFFDAFKAIFTRVLFSLHAMLAIWQVTKVTSGRYWLLAVTYSGLVVETFVVLLKRRGQEWRWFQWSIFLFLCVTVPPIWLLELTKLGRWGEYANITDFSEPATEQQSSSQLVKVGSLNTAAWVIILEQGLVVVIVIGRWFMPKGELTREELSALLLTYLGTAADIIAFLSILSEPNIVQTGPYLFAVLAVWTLSLLQFPFVVTATTKDEDEEEDDRPVTDYGSSAVYSRSKSALRKAWKERMNCLESFFETEVWGICVSVLMQDGPFVIMRMISIVGYGIITYTNYFFTVKNALVLLLQVYRIFALYVEYKKKKREKREEKKMIQLAKLYTNAFRIAPK